MSPPHVIIVGCGFGGLWAAQALRHAPVEVTVIDRTNHHLFTPLLYQVATAGLSAPSVAGPIRHILADQANTTVLLGEVRGVDLAKRSPGPHRNPEIPKPAVPRGTFVFVISDFLDPPPDDVWHSALERGLDVIPVVVQDPVWEQSFPVVDGAVLPVADPLDGKVRRVRLRRHEAAERRAANEARLAGLVESLEQLGLEPVLLGSADEERVLDGFLRWADVRRRSA